MDHIELLTNIVKSFVDKEDKVIIKQLSKTVVEISVDKSDIGKVIGKGGSMAKSIRTIIAAYSVKHQIRLNIEILE